MSKYFILLSWFFIFYSYQKSFLCKEINITLAHHNDSHGHYLEDEQGRGGFPKIKSLFKKIKPDLYLHSGDINTGPYESDFFQAEPDILALNNLGLHAMTLGNHDFDITLKDLKKQEKKAKFPFLSANIVDENNNLVYKPYVILFVKGLRVAIIGLTTEETLLTSNYFKDTSYKIEDPLKSLQKILPEIKKKSDIRILLSHLGSEEKRPNITRDEDIAQDLKKDDLHFILGGHTSQIFKEPKIINGIRISQAGCCNHFLSSLSFTWFKQEITFFHYQIHSIDKNISEDYFLKKNLLTYRKKCLKHQEMVHGLSKVKIETTRGELKKKSHPYGTFIAKSLKQKGHFSFINGGGIRHILNQKPPYNIREMELYQIFPFPNKVCSTKTKVKNFISYYKKILLSGKTFPHFSHQITLRPDGIHVGNNFFHHEEDLVFETTDFLLEGGDYYPRVTELDYFKINCYDNFSLRDSLRNFIQKNAIIEEKHLNYDLSI